MSTANPGVLSGVRVVEAGQVLAGPFAGAIFADLGAEVIKIERPEGGDDARAMGRAFRRGDAINFHIFNRGKKSLALDLKSGTGRDRLERVIATADIFIHNLRPGVPEALGIGGEALCARHPRLIYCEISAFGHVGPMQLDPGYEPLVQAFSGLSSTNGGETDPPMRAGASLCDQGAGMWAVIGALALLRRRQETGRGGIVNTSLLETALVWNAQRIDAYLNEGVLPERHRSGHPGFVPYESFATRDGQMLICAGNDRLFAKLAQLLQREEWIRDPRYATNRARLENKATLLAALSSILATDTTAKWIAALNRAGVPCAPVNTIPAVVTEPQFAALGLRQAIPGEDFALTRLPLAFDRLRPDFYRGAPALGAANDEF